MKKKITAPDGTVTELEGTAEELAAFEKPLREEGSSDKKNKKLLKDAVQKLAEIAEEQRKQNELVPSKPILPAKPTRPDDWPVWPPFSPWRVEPQIPCQPWEVSPYRRDWITSDSTQPCAVEQFFKDNPSATSVCLYCSCPRCNIQCLSTETVISCAAPAETARRWWRDQYVNGPFVSSGFIVTN